MTVDSPCAIPSGFLYVKLPGLGVVSVAVYQDPKGLR